MSNYVVNFVVELPVKEFTFLCDEAGSQEISTSKVLTQAIRIYELYKEGSLVRKYSEGGGCGGDT